MDFSTEPTHTISSGDDVSTIPILNPKTQLDVFDFVINHHIPSPPTPPPPPKTLSPVPLRYPETIPTLITIQPSSSPNKGLGIFASIDIPAGTILLSETPLLTLRDTGSRLDPLDLAVSSLSHAHRAAFLSLHGYSSSKHESRNRSIVYSNGYSVVDEFTTGVFETASRINHSCVPNCEYVWKEEIGKMVWWNRFGLLEGEEITVDYGHKPHWLKKIYGFECTCGGCTDSSSDVRSTTGSEGSGIEEKEMGSINEVVSQDATSGSHN